MDSAERSESSAQVVTKRPRGRPKRYSSDYDQSKSMERDGQPPQAQPAPTTIPPTTPITTPTTPPRTPFSPREITTPQCRDCRRLATSGLDNWFCQPCRPAHPLVFAKQVGFSYWPAKVVGKTEEGSFHVCFFGAKHLKAVLTPTKVKDIETDRKSLGLRKTPSWWNGGFTKAMKELEHHRELVRRRLEDPEPPEQTEDPVMPTLEPEAEIPSMVVKKRSRSGEHQGKENGRKRRKKSTESANNVVSTVVPMTSTSVVASAVNDVKWQPFVALANKKEIDQVVMQKSTVVELSVEFPKNMMKLERMTTLETIQHSTEQLVSQTSRATFSLPNGNLGMVSKQSRRLPIRPSFPRPKLALEGPKPRLAAVGSRPCMQRNPRPGRKPGPRAQLHPRAMATSANRITRGPMLQFSTALGQNLSSNEPLVPQMRHKAPRNMMPISGTRQLAPSIPSSLPTVRPNLPARPALRPTNPRQSLPATHIPVNRMRMRPPGTVPNPRPGQVPRAQRMANRTMLSSAQLRGPSVQTGLTGLRPRVPGPVPNQLRAWRNTSEIRSIAPSGPRTVVPGKSQKALTVLGADPGHGPSNRPSSREGDRLPAARQQSGGVSAGPSSRQPGAHQVHPGQGQDKERCQPNVAQQQYCQLCEKHFANRVSHAQSAEHQRMLRAQRIGWNLARSNTNQRSGALQENSRPAPHITLQTGANHSKTAEWDQEVIEIEEISESSSENEPSTPVTHERHPSLDLGYHTSSPLNSIDLSTSNAGDITRTVLAKISHVNHNPGCQQSDETRCHGTNVQQDQNQPSKLRFHASVGHQQYSMASNQADTAVSSVASTSQKHNNQCDSGTSCKHNNWLPPREDTQKVGGPGDCPALGWQPGSQYRNQANTGGISSQDWSQSQSEPPGHPPAQNHGNPGRITPQVLEQNQGVQNRVPLQQMQGVQGRTSPQEWSQNQAAQACGPPQPSQMPQARVSPQEWHQNQAASHTFPAQTGARQGRISPQEWPQNQAAPHTFPAQTQGTQGRISPQEWPQNQAAPHTFPAQTQGTQGRISPQEWPQNQAAPHTFPAQTQGTQGRISPQEWPENQAAPHTFPAQTQGTQGRISPQVRAPRNWTDANNNWSTYHDLQPVPMNGLSSVSSANPIVPMVQQQQHFKYSMPQVASGPKSDCSSTSSLENFNIPWGSCGTELPVNGFKPPGFMSMLTDSVMGFNENHNLYPQVEIQTKNGCDPPNLQMPQSNSGSETSGRGSCSSQVSAQSQDNKGKVPELPEIRGSCESMPEGPETQATSTTQSDVMEKEKVHITCGSDPPPNPTLQDCTEQKITESNSSESSAMEPSPENEQSTSQANDGSDLLVGTDAKWSENSTQIGGTDKNGNGTGMVSIKEKFDKYASGLKDVEGKFDKFVLGAKDVLTEVHSLRGDLGQIIESCSQLQNFVPMEH